MKIKKFNEKKKDTKIICVFSGCGKTYLSENEKNKIVLDLDKDQKTFLKRDFPNYYIQYVKENIGVADIILVSSHKEIRDSLTKENIEFSLVYPNRNLKENFKKNYFKRGSTQLFVDVMNKNWDNWIDQMIEQKCYKKIELQENQFLSDLINENKI